MKRHMPKIINAFILIFGLFISLSATSNNTSLFSGITLLLVGCFSELIRTKRKKAHVKERIEQLTNKPWDDAQTLYLSKPLWPLVFLLIGSCICIWVLYFQFEKTHTNWFIFTGGSILTSALLINTVYLFFCIRKPAVILSKKGFISYPHNFVTWENVQDINLFEQTKRGIKTSILHFRVSNYRGKLNWIERLLTVLKKRKFSKQYFSIILAEHAQEKPKVVLAVATFLWKEVADLECDWALSHSDKYDQAMARLQSRQKNE